jgi:predicted nucleic acid-binding protein
LILYLDTSAFVKLLHREEGSETVRSAFGQAQAIASSALAQVEVHSALARLRREGAADEVLRGWLGSFSELWNGMAQVSMDRAVGPACGLCLRYPLRALDAVHLASALLLRGEGGLELVFATWDGRLKDAARQEGFLVLD